MIKVTFQNTVFECYRAVKGVNYVRLYDENNIQTAAFEEVQDFSAFTIKDGMWEKGKSTQRVAAQATASGTQFILTIKDKAVVEDGLFISFDAPASSTGIETVRIESTSYALCNAAGENVSQSVDCFAKGAKLEIVLSTDDNIAYLQNSAVSKENLCALPSVTETQNVAKALQFVNKLNDAETRYNLFGEHNKPIGTYVGNGSSEERNIETGGIGSAVCIRSNKGAALLFVNGAITVDLQGNVAGISGAATNITNFAKIQLRTAHELINASGVTYQYHVL